MSAECRTSTALLLHGGNSGVESLVVGKYVVFLEPHRGQYGQRGRFPFGSDSGSNRLDLMRDGYGGRGRSQYASLVSNLYIWVGGVFH